MSFSEKENVKKQTCTHLLSNFIMCLKFPKVIRSTAWELHPKQSETGAQQWNVHRLDDDIADRRERINKKKNIYHFCRYSTLQNNFTFVQFSLFVQSNSQITLKKKQIVMQLQRYSTQFEHSLLCDVSYVTSAFNVP